MSTHTYSKEHPPIVKRVIDGKEISVPLTETKFGKTSDHKGESFWTIEVTAANQETTRPFFGDDVINGALTRLARRFAMDAAVDKNGLYETKDENGHFIWDNYLKALSEFDSGGATLGDLNDQRDEIIDVNYAMMEDPNFEMNEDGTFTNPEEGKRLQSLIYENNGKLKKIKSKIQSIEEKYAKIAAKRQASKLAPATS